MADRFPCPDCGALIFTGLHVCMDCGKARRLQGRCSWCETGTVPSDPKPRSWPAWRAFACQACMERAGAWWDSIRGGYESRAYRSPEKRENVRETKFGVD